MPTSIKTIAISSVVLVFTLMPATGFAAELRGADQAIIGSSEVITNDLYIAGGSVTSSGAIQGSLSSAGGTVLVTGPVSGDVTAAGGTLTLLGSVGGAIRAMGGNITIGSTVGSDIVVAGGQVQITGGRVGRDVVVAGGTVRIDSPVTGNVRFVGGELYINAPIAGNVDADAQKVTLGSGAVISGTLGYKAPQKAVMDAGAQVKGAVSYAPKISEKVDFKAHLAGLLAFWLVAKALMLLVAALVLGLYLRRYSEQIVRDAFSKPLTELGRGLVALIVIPIASVILLVTVVGIPFGVLGLLGFVMLALISTCTTPILLGSLVHKWIAKSTTYQVSWKTILLGVALYFICACIPVVGWIILFGFWLIALGAIIKMKMHFLSEWR